jgi:HK97 family phage major capsid protein
MKGGEKNMEENKAVLQEVIAELKKGVTDEVLSAVEKKLADWRKISGMDKFSDDEKQKAVEYIKAKTMGDYAKAKALSPGTTGEGKELIPTYLATEIVRVAGEYGVVARNSRKIPMKGINLKFPTIADVIFTRKSPNGSFTVSEPGTSNAFDFTLQEVGTIVPFSNEMLLDPNVNVIDALALLAGEGLAKGEDTWGLLGQASGEGIFQNTNVSGVVLATGKTHYSDVTADDLLSALALIKGRARRNLKWVMSWSVLLSLYGLKDSQGRYIVREPSGTAPATVWGVPVEISDVMPETSEPSQAGKKFIALANFDYVGQAQYGGMVVDISKEATIKKDASTTYNLFQDHMSAVKFVAYEDIKIAMADKAFAYIKTASS